MRKGYLPGALVGIACLAGSVTAPVHAAQIAWAKSYPAALEKAKASKKLVMVDFYTEW